MSTWEQAEIDYMAGMKYREIAEKYGVSLKVQWTEALTDWIFIGVLRRNG